MAEITLTEKQYEVLKGLILKEDEEMTEEQGLSDSAEECLMKLKYGLDSFYTGIKVGYFDVPHEIDEPVENPFLNVWTEYLEPAYKLLSKHFYESRIYQNSHGEGL